MQLLLEKNELFDFGENPGAVSVHCQAGCCWLTQAGDSRDHILRAGQSHNVLSRGKVLVMAIAATQLQVLPALNNSNAVSLWRQACCSR